MADSGHTDEKTKSVDKEEAKPQAAQELTAHRGGHVISDDESEVEQDVLSVSIDEELEKSILDTSRASEDPEDRTPISPLIKLGRMKIEGDDIEQQVKKCDDGTITIPDDDISNQDASTTKQNELGATKAVESEGNDQRSRLRGGRPPPGHYQAAHTGKITPVAKCEKEAKTKIKSSTPKAQTAKTNQQNKSGKKTDDKATEELDPSKSEESGPKRSNPIQQSIAELDPNQKGNLQQSIAGKELNQKDRSDLQDADLRKQMKQMESSLKTKDREIATLKDDNNLLKTENDIMRQDLDEKNTQSSIRNKDREIERLEANNKLLKTERGLMRQDLDEKTH